MKWPLLGSAFWPLSGDKGSFADSRALATKGLQRSLCEVLSLLEYDPVSESTRTLAKSPRGSARSKRSCVGNGSMRTDAASLRCEAHEMPWGPISKMCWHPRGGDVAPRRL